MGATSHCMGQLIHHHNIAFRAQGIIFHEWGNRSGSIKGTCIYLQRSHQPEAGDLNTKMESCISQTQTPFVGLYSLTFSSDHATSVSSIPALWGGVCLQRNRWPKHPPLFQCMSPLCSASYVCDLVTQAPTSTHEKLVT